MSKSLSLVELKLRRAGHDRYRKRVTVPVTFSKCWDTFAEDHEKIIGEMVAMVSKFKKIVPEVKLLVCQELAESDQPDAFVIAEALAEMPRFPKYIQINLGEGYIAIDLTIKKEVVFSNAEIEKAEKIFGPRPDVCVQEYS